MNPDADDAAHGYDPDFLGIPVPLPRRCDDERPALVLLPYRHRPGRLLPQQPGPRPP